MTARGAWVTKGVSTLEPDSIHINFTPQSTSYETKSIHFDCFCTTSLTRCDHVQGPLFVYVIGRAFCSKSSGSAEMLFWLLVFAVTSLQKKRQSFGVGALDHKESRNETEAAIESVMD